MSKVRSSQKKVTLSELNNHTVNKTIMKYFFQISLVLFFKRAMQTDGFFSAGAKHISKRV